MSHSLLPLSRLLVWAVLLSGFVASAEPVKIGVPLPLTGAASAVGSDTKNALIFANEVLANNRYSLIFEDDRCDPREAVAIAHKLVEVDRVRYTVGYCCSGPLLAAAPIYEKARVVAIAASASAAKVSAAGNYIFRTWPSDGLGIKTLARYMGARHKRVGVLYEQTEYSEGLLQGLLDNRGGLEIVGEGYAPGTTDFRTLILRLQKKEIDAVFLDPQGDSTIVPMLQQLHQMGINWPRYAMYYGSGATVRQQAGRLAEGLMFADPPDAESVTTAEGRELLGEFQKRYRVNFSSLLVLASIEAFRAVDAAIQSKRDPLEFLYGARFRGTLGDWSFDGNGDIVGARFVMKRIEEGRIVTLAD